MKQSQFILVFCIFAYGCQGTPAEFPLAGGRLPLFSLRKSGLEAKSLVLQTSRAQDFGLSLLEFVPMFLFFPRITKQTPPPTWGSRATCR